jgi:hypothetical protein
MAQEPCDRAAPDGFFHLFNGRSPLWLWHYSPKGRDVALGWPKTNLAVRLYDEPDAIAGIEPQLHPDFFGHSDLAFAGHPRFAHDGSTFHQFPYSL